LNTGVGIHISEPKRFKRFAISIYKISRKNKVQSKNDSPIFSEPGITKAVCLQCDSNNITFILTLQRQSRRW